MASELYESRSKVWDISGLKNRGYRDRSIVRVEMKNFLTYEHCVVFPGPRLNVVLGPNGTGKSALTHAICLACGGDPRSVGRSPDLTQFVKRGEEGQLSYAAVDILAGDKVATVRREINDETKGSKWFINGRSSTKTDVKKLMVEYNIDVDNLCSFMAQDKVGSFSQASPKEILHMTLESIVNSDGKKLSDEQKELAGVEGNKLARQRERDIKQTVVENLQNDIAGMEAEVLRMQNRQTKMKHLGEYKIKAIVVDAKESRHKVQQAQEEVDIASDAYENGKSGIEPTENERRDVERKIAERSKSTKALSSKLEAVEESVISARDEVDHSEMLIEKALQKVSNLEKEAMKVSRGVEDARVEYEKKKADFEKADFEIPGIKVAITELKNEVRELTASKNSEEEHLEQIRGENEAPTEVIRVARNQLKKLTDHGAIFEEKLKKAGQQGASVLKAMNWLKQNSHLLRGSCFGPIAAHITSDDPDAQAVAENAIGWKNLVTFVTTNDDDEKLLRRELNGKLKCRIDLSTVKSTPVRRKPFDSAILGHFRDEFHCQGYLLDQLTMPPEVRSHLITWSNTDLLLWARGANAPDLVSDDHIARLCGMTRTKSPTGQVVGGSVQLYAVDSTRKNISKFEGNFLRYGPATAAPMITRFEVAGPNGLLSSGGDNESEREEILRKIGEAEQQLNDIKLRSGVVQKRAQNFIKDLDIRKASLTSMNQRLKAPDMKKSAMVRAKKAYDEQQEELRVLEDPTTKNIIKKSLTLAVNTQLKAFRDLNDEIKKYFAMVIKKETLNICSGDLEFRLEAIKRELVEKKKLIEELKGVMDIAKAHRSTAQAVLEKATSALQGVEREYGTEAFVQMWGDINEHCPEESSEAIQDRIDALQRELNEAVDNSDIIDRYEETKIELANAQEDLNACIVAFESASTTMVNRSANWKRSVGAVVQKMNVRFKEYMNELLFRGELLLKEIGTIDQYEMVLKVAFREGETLSELSGTRHSGGERAVSTIMYLMALQEMTSSPFRVVDEVNQGMDERNERLVFDRIVQSCCGDVSKSQYFLVSPKLLQGLRSMEHDDVTVLLVWNGPGITNKWQLPEVIAGLKRKLEQRGIDISAAYEAQRVRLAQSAAGQIAQNGNGSSPAIGIGNASPNSSFNAPAEQPSEGTVAGKGKGKGSKGKVQAKGKGAVGKKRRQLASSSDEDEVSKDTSTELDVSTELEEEVVSTRPTSSSRRRLAV